MSEFDFSTAVLEEEAPSDFDFATAEPIDANAPEPSAAPTPLPSITWKEDQPAWRIDLDPVTLNQGVMFDPERIRQGVDEAHKAGAIDDDQKKNLEWDVKATEGAIRQRRELEARAGENPEMKAAIMGLGKGGAQTLAALGAFKAAGAGATLLAAETGPAAPIIGTVAGTLTAIPAAWGAGKAFDRAYAEFAKHDEEFDSMLAARQLKPGYDQAGQLAFVLAPLPSSGINLYKAFNTIRAAEGTSSAVKFLAQVGGLGAATGAAGDVAVQSLDKATNDPERDGYLAPGPTWQSALTASALGLGTAGLMVGNRRYTPEDIRAIFTKAQRGEDITEAEGHVVTKAMDSVNALQETIRAQGSRPEPGTAYAQADQVTFLGRPVATNAEAGVRVPPRSVGAPPPAADFDFSTMAPESASPSRPGLPTTERGFTIAPSSAPVRQPVSADESALRWQPFAALPDIPTAPAPEPRRFSTAFLGSPYTPIVNYIAEQGGIKPRSQSERAGGEYDEQIPVQELGGFGRVVYGGNRPADLMAQDLYEANLLPSPDPSAMWAAIGHEVTSYRGARKNEEHQVKEVQKATRFAKAALNDRKGTSPLPVSSLNVGDQVKVGTETMKVTGIDPDSFAVTLEDGKKFGVQQVADGTLIYAEEHEPAAQGGDDFDFDSAELIPEGGQQFTAPPVPVMQVTPSGLPTISTNGEGILLNENDLPFNLSGEVDDGPARQRALDEQQRSEEARAEAERQQTELFTGRSKLKGDLTAEVVSNLRRLGWSDEQIRIMPDWQADNIIAGSIAAEPPAQKPTGGRRSGTFADSGPVGSAPLPATPSTFDPVYAHADLSSKGPGWQMPVTLGGLPNMLPIEGPELVNMARQLGAEVSVRNMPKSLGLFYPVGNGKIALSPRIFSDPKSVLMTLAHEIGHFADYLPDRPMNRGNILGRIATLRNFLATTIDLSPTTPSRALTPKDRRAIRRQAEKDTEAALGPKPSPGDPGAMTWAQAASDQYKVLLDAEIVARKLGTNDKVREELIALSDWWKPYLSGVAAGTVPDAYAQYRESSPELYADAISVLFNSPADLKGRAPTFWDMFWNYADRKPELKAAVMDLQTLLFKGPEAVNSERLKRSAAAFGKGEEIFVRKMREQAAKNTTLRGWWTALKDQYYNTFQAAIDKQHELERSGATLSMKDRMDYLFEEHPMGNNSVSLLMEDVWNRVVKPLKTAGLSETDLGQYLMYSRIANERYDVTKKVGKTIETIEQGRSVLANPEAHNPGTATASLAELERQLGPSAWAELVGAAERFHDQVYAVMERAADAGVISRQLFDDVITPNRQHYATFTPLDYVDTSLTSSMKHGKGTLADIANPFQQTLLKMVAVLRSIQDNTAKRGLIDFMQRHFAGEITEATMRFNGRHNEPVPPKDRDLGLITFLDDGKVRGVYLQKRYADMFESKTPQEKDVIVGLMRGFWGNVVYPLIIKYNPAFQLFMSPVRDFQRTMHHAPRGTRARIAVQYAKEIAAGFASMATRGAIPSTATSRLEATFDDVMREMIENHAIAAPHDSFLVSYDASDAFGEMMRKYHLLPEEQRGKFMSSWAGRMIAAPMRWIQYAGQIMEAAPKIATYKVLARDLGWNGREAGAYVRNYVGIPNYLKKGRKIGSAGVLVPFLNIIIRGYESSAKMATGREKATGPKQNAKSWKDYLLWYMLAGGAIPMVLQTLAREGAFGEDLERMYSRVSDYNATNYLVVPVGETKTGDFGGKTAFVRLPQDESDRLLNGILHKTLTAMIRVWKGDPQQGLGRDIGEVAQPYVPGVNPMLEIGSKWAQFLENQNPSDGLHGNPILSNDEWLAGGWPAYSKMGMWTVDQLGISNFARYDQHANTTTEMVLGGTPILNRLLIITDSGLREQQNDAEMLEDMEIAKVRTSLGKDTLSLRRQATYVQKIDPRRRSEAQARQYPALKVWYYKVYRPAMDQVSTLIEMGNEEAARERVKSLEVQSTPFLRMLEER